MQTLCAPLQPAHLPADLPSPPSLNSLPHAHLHSLPGLNSLPHAHLHSLPGRVSASASTNCGIAPDEVEE